MWMLDVWVDLEVRLSVLCLCLRLVGLLLCSYNWIFSVCDMYTCLSLIYTCVSTEWVILVCMLA